MAKIRSRITSFSTSLILMLASIITSTIGKPQLPISLPPELFQELDFAEKLQSNSDAIASASVDFGNIIHTNPSAVLYPSSPQDIANLIKISTNSSVPFTISARGHGHSVNGQAMASNGVVVDMMHLRNQNKVSRITVSKSPYQVFFADAGGEQLWIDVLHAALEHGLAPMSWTDYLYLTIGGTLSNAGISGQSFRYGPQINNVLELDVITGNVFTDLTPFTYYSHFLSTHNKFATRDVMMQKGKGELITCSKSKNSDLFFAVLGGLGQFGIIVRARIALQPAPKRVKWVRMLYKDFSSFTKDQESLISINGLDYLEGSLLMDQGPPNNWRSSFFPSSDIPRIMSLATQHGIIYCLEVAKYYDDGSKYTVAKELQKLLKGLSFIDGMKFEKDVTFVDFLDRVRNTEAQLDVTHPWLNLFLPKSSISQFNSGVFRDIVLKRNITTNGPVLCYPMNRNKWDDRMSAIIPDGDVFYTVGFLYSSGFNDWGDYYDQNKELLDFCDKAGLKVVQYLPHYRTQEEWIKKHFGSKWERLRELKAKFDPKMILSPGQRIFNHN